MCKIFNIYIHLIFLNVHLNEKKDQEKYDRTKNLSGNKVTYIIDPN